MAIGDPTRILGSRTPPGSTPTSPYGNFNPVGPFDDTSDPDTARQAANYLRRLSPQPVGIAGGCGFRAGVRPGRADLEVAQAPKGQKPADRDGGAAPEPEAEPPPPPPPPKRIRCTPDGKCVEETPPEQPPPPPPPPPKRIRCTPDGKCVEEQPPAPQPDAGVPGPPPAAAPDAGVPEAAPPPAAPDAGAPAAPADPKAAAQALMREGQTHFKGSRFSLAAAAFKRGYALDPDPEFLFALGECYRHLNNKPEALRYYREYLRKRPDAYNRRVVEGYIKELEAPALGGGQAGLPPPGPTGPTPAPGPAVPGPAASGGPPPSPPQWKPRPAQMPRPASNRTELFARFDEFLPGHLETALHFALGNLVIKGRIKKAYKKPDDAFDEARFLADFTNVVLTRLKDQDWDDILAAGSDPDSTSFTLKDVHPALKGVGKAIVVGAVLVEADKGSLHDVLTNPARFTSYGSTWGLGIKKASECAPGVITIQFGDVTTSVLDPRAFLDDNEVTVVNQNRNQIWGNGVQYWRLATTPPTGCPAIKDISVNVGIQSIFPYRRGGKNGFVVVYVLMATPTTQLKEKGAMDNTLDSIEKLAE